MKKRKKKGKEERVGMVVMMGAESGERGGKERRGC